jgi:hypothetical protein
MTSPLRGFNDKMIWPLQVIEARQRRVIEVPQARSHFVIKCSQ